MERSDGIAEASREVENTYASQAQEISEYLFGGGMSEISLTVDGRNIEAEEGMMILQAAEAAGIEIPHLCYHDQLSPFAGCRLCVVEVEGAKSLVASCAYPVAEGLVVRTDTERVRAVRRLALELILSDHPLDCLVCEQAGRCKLQDYAYQMGLSGSRFVGERHEYPVDVSNPFIRRDYSKCILCGRCVQICAERQVSDAIDFSFRGFQTKVAVPFDRPLQESDCVFCGQCVSVCPTGALLEKTAVGKGRAWEMETVRTICPYCGCGCTLELNVKDGAIVKVTSAEDSPIGEGCLCVKGRFGWDFVHSPERLTTPLIRRDGKFEEATWDEALALVARRLGEIRDEYGSDAMATLSSAKCTNEENYLVQKFTRAVLGTNSVDHCARL